MIAYKRYLARLLTSVCLLSLLAILSGCGQGSEFSVDNGIVATELATPEQLRGLRAVSNPQLEVTINDSKVPASQNSDTQLWSASFAVNLGEQHHIEIRWTEQSNDQPPLELIRAEEWFSTATTDPINIIFNRDQYDSSSDSDGDGRSNLAELQQDTNPRDAQDPPEPPQEVILNVELPKPEELAQQFAISEENLIVRATLNNDALPGGFREDLNWFGQDTVAADLPAYVTVEWCYRLTSGDLYRLLRFARSIDIGSENKFIVSHDVDYNSDYDLDADGVSNIREIADGTQPENAEQSSACL